MSAEPWPFETPSPLLLVPDVSGEEAPSAQETIEPRSEPLEDNAESTGQTLPRYCFTPEVARKFTERERVMLSYMIAAGRELAPADLSAQITDRGRSAPSVLVSIFLKKAQGIEGLGHNIERGRTGRDRYCKWLGEQAIVEWPPHIPASRPSVPSKPTSSTPVKGSLSRNPRSSSSPRGSSTARSSGAPAAPVVDTVKYQPREVVRIERDEARGKQVLSDWGMSILETAGNRILSCQGEGLSDLDDIAVDIVEAAAEVSGGLSTDQIRRMLNEYAEEPISTKGVIDRLIAITATLAPRGVEGWKDSLEERDGIQGLRVVHLDPRSKQGSE